MFLLSLWFWLWVFVVVVMFSFRKPQSKTLRTSTIKADSVFVLCVTEDAGSDQKAQRLMLLSYLCNDEDGDDFSNIWYFDVSCLVHQFNLIVGSHLALIDECLSNLGYSFRYYSSLAKLIHSWRSMPKAIMAEFPPEHFASMKLPPAPCAARWGCVHELEAFLLAIGVKEVQRAFAHASAMFVANRKKKANPASASKPVDEIAFDEYSEFQERMSRYMRSACQTVKDAVFWFFVTASFQAKEPLIRCFAWLQTPRETPMLDFVCGQAFEFLQQLQALTVDGSWVTTCFLESGAGSVVSEEVQGVMAAAAIRIALHNLTAFERRIYSYVSATLGNVFSPQISPTMFAPLVSSVFDSVSLCQY